jgi:hypothetical protein
MHVAAKDGKMFEFFEDGKSMCRYFALISGCCAILLGTVGSLGSILSDRVTHTLVLGLVTALSNLVFIEPKATSVLFERYKLENSGRAVKEERQKLTKTFGARIQHSCLVILLLMKHDFCMQLGVFVDGITIRRHVARHGCYMRDVTASIVTLLSSSMHAALTCTTYLLLLSVTSQNHLRLYDASSGVPCVISRPFDVPRATSAGMLHGLSSIANLGNLFAAVAHAVWLGSKLHNVAL